MENPLQKVSRIIQSEGPAALLRRISGRFSTPSASRHPFDTENKVDTAGLLHASDLITGHDNDHHGYDYWGVAPSLFRGALAPWLQSLAATPYTASDYTFIDLGSGKGRALLLASEFPFDRILGVELSPVLTSTAQRNVATWLLTPRACTRIQALHGDALDFPLPDTPVLLYLFNPFDADLTRRLANRLQALAANRSRPVDIVYLNPKHAAVIEEIPDLQTLFKDYVPFSLEDSTVDPYRNGGFEVYLYRLAPR